MSFLNVSVERTDGHTAFVGEALRLTAAPAAAARLGGRSGDLVLGVRPEDVRVSLSPRQDAIEGRILDVEPMGREFVVAVTVGREVVVALVGHGFAGRHDQPVWLEIPPDRLYAFDPATGAAVP
jgi:multiple sugar transport system ATP-binding protein